ncbi:hypothetical protein J5N97_011496 [Dioscorea zingiberensis]|uniref:Pentatricopeptide repeat-containing protein n=1 Tax=Dioscorea zingiberensis TaxID=325984 RepID=A0A9D5D0Q6_9LILI|nr:hypothetical protein J5N97_011496 [Dioscorea zingiberensis]
MLGSKVISLARPPPAFVHSQTLIRPTVISCVPDEKTADPAPDPPARKSPRGSSQLNRWSMARSIRAGRRLARPAQGKDSTATRTASPIQPSISGADEEEVDSGEDDGEMSTAKEIYMVSDGTGWTAEHSVNAALGQFEHCLVDRGCAVNTHLFSMVRFSSPPQTRNRQNLIFHLNAREGMLVFGQALKPSMLSLRLSLPPCASNVESNSLRVSSNKRFGIASSELSLALQHCIETRSFNDGRKIHSQIREAGFEKNRDLLPKLIKFYSVCGRADVARELFDRIPKRNLDVFIWTSMISAYIKNGFPGEAIKLFSEMLTLGLMPDSYTVSALVKASTGLGYNGLVNQLHSMSVKCGCCSSLSVPNSLIHAYGTFGNIDAAFRVFDRIELRDIVSWSSMVRACSCLEKYAESMSLFSRMQSEEHLTANEITLVSVLPACSFFSSLRKGQAIHAYVIRKGFDQNPIVNAALVTMYSRCGDPGGAFVVFNSMVEWNVVLWTSMIEGFAMNGEFDLALNLFERIQKLGLKPNYVTLVVILAACSHGGLIDEGLKIFWTMKERFGITPQIEHYACVVDMLGRGGRLDDAEKFIEKMAIPPSASVYGSLLGACQAHRECEAW